MVPYEIMESLASEIVSHLLYFAVRDPDLKIVLRRIAALSLTTRTFHHLVSDPFFLRRVRPEIRVWLPIASLWKYPVQETVLPISPSSKKFVSPDGKLLGILRRPRVEEDEGHLGVYRLSSDEIRQPPLLSLSLDDRIESLTFSTDGSLVLFPDGISGAYVHWLDGSRSSLHVQIVGLRTQKVLSDGTRIVILHRTSPFHRHIHVYDLEGKLLQQYDGIRSSIDDIFLDPEHFSTLEGNTLVRWLSPIQRVVVHNFPLIIGDDMAPRYYRALSQDRSLLGWIDGGSLHTQDLGTQVITHLESPAPSRRYREIAVSSDGSLILGVTTSPSVPGLDLYSQTRFLFSLVSGEEHQSKKEKGPAGPGSDFYPITRDSVVISPDGTTIIFGDRMFQVLLPALLRHFLP